MHPKLSLLCAAIVCSSSLALAQYPDLAPDALSFQPSVWEGGRTVSVVVPVRNLRPYAATTTSRVRVDISTTSDFSSDVRTLGIGTLGPVAALGSQVAYVTAAVSTALPAGAYYVRANVNYTRQLREITYSNNIRIGGPVTVRQLPDLTVSAFSFTPSTVYTPGSLELSATVANSGPGAAVTSVLRFEVSTDSSFATGVRAIGQRSIGALSPQQSVSTRYTASVPVLPDGAYYVRAICDYGNRNRERSEANNTRVATSRVTLERALPDLTAVNPVILSSSLNAGENASLRFTLRNIGTRDLSVPINYAVRLSRDTRYTRKDDALIAGTRLSFSTASPLRVNESRDVTVPFRVPTCVDQIAHTFFIEVESGLAVDERDENNNVASVARLLLRYEGSVPRLEFTTVGDGTRVAWTAGIFGPGQHRKATICTTSRPNIGNWSLLVWSFEASSPLPDAAFQVAISAVNTPIFANWFALVPSSGHLSSGFDWSGATNTYNATVYAHSLIFKSDFSAFVTTGGGLAFRL